MTGLKVQPVDIGRWRELARTFADYNYRQVWGFGQACAARRGASSEHVAVSGGAEVLGLADVRIRRTPLWHTGMAYINGGPLVRRGAQGDLRSVRLVLAALRRTYVEQRRLLLRVAPSPGPPQWNRQLREAYAAAGFEQSRAPVSHTILIDLSPTPAELRKSLHGKWRNCLNQAERQGLTLRSGTEDALLDCFCGLFDQLIARKAFAVDLDASFYARVQSQLAADEKFVITLAEKDGTPLAGHVAGLQGDTAVYLLGASNEAGLRSRASYLLQWEVLLRARGSGYRWYDLGGIDPLNNPGVYRFKHGMGGTELSAPGPFEASPGELRRLIVCGGERVYRAVRSHLGVAR